MKKRKKTPAKRSVEQTVSQKRNWAKRVISCYTAGYRTILNHYQDSLTHRELANIEAMIVTGTILLDNWTGRKDDK